MNHADTTDKVSPCKDDGISYTWGMISASSPCPLSSSWTTLCFPSLPSLFPDCLPLTVRSFPLCSSIPAAPLLPPPSPGSRTADLVCTSYFHRDPCSRLASPASPATPRSALLLQYATTLPASERENQTDWDRQVRPCLPSLSVYR